MEQLEGGAERIVDEDEQVRQTGVQGFAAEGPRAPQTDGEDFAVGEEHEDGGQKDNDDGAQQSVHFAQQRRAAAAAQADEAVDVAVNPAEPRAAERQAAGEQHRAAHQPRGQQPAEQQQRRNRGRRHERGVAQRAADRQVAVEGHGRQQHEAGAAQREHHEGLTQTRRAGHLREAAARQHVGQKFGINRHAARERVQQNRGHEGEHRTAKLPPRTDEINHQRVTEHHEHVNR